MSMAPPPPPTRGHRSTASAPSRSTGNGGFKVPDMPTLSTPSRPAPPRPATPQNQASTRGTGTPSFGQRDRQSERPATPSSQPSQSTQPTQRPTTPHTHNQQRPTTPYNQPTRDTRPTTPYGTPYGQPTHSHDPSMSAASSVSAASAAVDSPRVYARYGAQASHDGNTTLRDHAGSPSVDLKTASKLSDSSRPSDNAGSRTASRFSDPEPPTSRFSNPTPSAPSTPTRGVHRVSRSVGCYPVSPAVEARLQNLESPSQAKLVEPTLPPVPSVWTPSELAQYLAWALRTGGADRQGPTLPSPVVEDVVTWVLRSRVTGEKFVTGVDQGVTRPPPFLPVLAALSRRLRRRSAARVSDANTEAESEHGGEDQVTRVRRLAHAFDVISSASEASGDEGPSLSVLREQLTGDSVHGFGRATPKTEPRNWARRDSVASVASAASGMSAGSLNSSRWRQRMVSDASDASASSAAVWVTEIAEHAARNESPTAPLRAKAEAKAALELAELASLAHSQAKDTSSKAANDSPPPPYDTSVVPSPAAHPALLFPPTSVASPQTPDGATRSGSLTPLRPVHGPNSSSPESDSSPSPSHMHRMASHRAGGANPYGALRRSSRGARPTALMFTHEEAKSKEATPGGTNVDEDGDDADSDAENKPPNKHSQAHWSTTRRVTARPLRPLNPATLSPSPSAPQTPPISGLPGGKTPSAAPAVTPTSLRRRRERDMAREVASLTDRIRELEARLAVVETPAASTTGSAAGSALCEAADAEAAEIDSGESAASPTKPPPESDDVVPYSRPPLGWLARFGLADADGTEPRLQDVPAVLFLLGVGVGVGFSAVVVRLLIHRRLTA